MASEVIDSFSALSADMVTLITVGFSLTGIAALVIGLYLLKVGRKEDVPYLAALATVGFLGAWSGYGQYQALLAMGNGVETGPIYEAVAVIIVLCMCFGVVLNAIVHRPRKYSKA